MKRLLSLAGSVLLALLVLTCPARAQTLESGPVMLSEILLEARRANPDLEAARARYRSAREIGAQASAFPDPELSLTWSPKPTQTRAGPLDYRVGLKQRIPFWGERGLREERADHMAGALEAAATSAEFDLDLEVRLAFFEWLFAREALAINESNRSLLSQFQRIAEQRYRAGLVPQSDPLKAGVALARVDAMDAGFRRAVENARARVNVLLNRTPDSPLGEPQAPPLALEVPAYGTLVAAALGARPELRGAQREIAAGQSALDLSRKDYWPDLSLGADYGLVKGGTNPGFAKDGDDIVSVMVGLNVPIQVGIRSAAVRERSAALAAAQAKADGLAQRVQLEVHEHYTRLAEMREVLALYRERIIPTVQLELDATRQAYSGAKASFLELLDSERSLEEVLMEQARALREYRQSRARLQRAVGAPLTKADAGATEGSEQ